MIHLMARDEFFQRLQHGFEKDPFEASNVLLQSAVKSFVEEGCTGGMIFSFHQSRKSMLAWVDFLEHAQDIFEVSDHKKWSEIIIKAVDAVTSNCCICRQYKKWEDALDKCVIS